MANPEAFIPRIYIYKHPSMLGEFKTKHLPL